MFKLVLEKAEEPEIKLPTSAGSSRKQESSRKIMELLRVPLRSQGYCAVGRGLSVNFFFKFVDYLFLVLLDFRCYSWTSSSFGEQDCSLVMVSGLLIAWASLVGGEQALGMWAQ